MAKGKYSNKKTKPMEQFQQQTEETKTQSDTYMNDMARLDFENQMEHEKAGKEAPTYGFWGWLYGIQQKYGKKELHKVNKKTYILLAIFTGFMGGHRFYEKRYIVAALYLLFFWTFVPLTMVVIDLMVVIPKQADSEGMIEL